MNGGEVGLEIWEQIIQVYESEQYVFNKLLKYKAPDKEWYLKEQAEDFFFTYFDKQKYYEQKMEYIETIFQRSTRKRIIPILGYYLKQKIDLMRKTEVSEETFKQFRQEYWENAEVQTDYIEEKL